MAEAAQQPTFNRTFTLDLDSAKVPLIITQKALDDFECQGLPAMDDCLMHLTERLTPANAPEMRPKPLDLVGQMILDGVGEGNTHKVMLCALWLGHHYPSITQMTSHGAAFSFTQIDATPQPCSVLRSQTHV